MSHFSHDSSSESDSDRLALAPDNFFGNRIPRSQWPYPNIVFDYSSSEDSNNSNTSSSSSSSCINMMLNTSEEPSYDDSEDSNSSGGSLFSPLVERRPSVPKYNYWSLTDELYNREIGNYKNSAMWSNKFYQSLVAVQKLRLSKQLKKHRGCVNALDFNKSGDLLVSGSDDRKICLWDWSRGRCLCKYDTPHKRNIFQTKFLSIQGSDHTIVSSSQDGLIVLSVVNNSGCQYNKVIANHTGSCNKLAVHSAEPYVVLSCGDDGFIKNIDIRESPIGENVAITHVLHESYNNGNTMHFYGIDINPMNSLEFILNGDDEYVRLYDKRNMRSGPVKKFCNSRSISRQVDDESDDSNSSSISLSLQEVHITSAVYNYCGTEILASYSEEDIYLFDVNDPETYLHRYSGHSNIATVKSVNFYGPRSDYVVSGSDCGNIFIWDKKSEAIVQRKRADLKGAVNVLEGHPFMPTLATSGLDNTIKIWEPLNTMQKPNKMQLKMCVVKNKIEKQRIQRRTSFTYN